MARSKDPETAIPVREIPSRKGVTTGKPNKIALGAMRSKVAFPAAGGGVMQGSGGNWYSPELSTDFLELPQSIDEQRNFYRFFYDHDPFVGQAIDLLGELPLSKIRLRKPAARNKALAEASYRFCTKWADEIGLLHRLIEIVHDWNLIGEVFLFCEDNSPDMPRTVTHEVYREITPEGKIVEEERELPDADKRAYKWLRKNYKGWTALEVLPPEQIHMESFPFTNERLIELVPDSKTRGIIERANMGDERALRIVDSMPKDIVEHVTHGRNIPLNTDPDAGSFIHYMARKKSRYEPRGKSLLQRILRTLVFRDKVRQSLTSIASRHMTPYRLIYGENMNEEQTNSLREQVDLALQDPDYSIVTNFQVNWEEMGADQRLPDWSWVWDFTDRQMSAGLGVTETLLTGESVYSGDRIHLEVINTRFLLLREVLQDMVEKYLFRPMCRRMGFVEHDEDGELVVITPRLSFTRLPLRDNQETFDALFNLYQKGSLDIGTIFDLLNIDSDEVREKLKQDFGTIQDATFNEVTRALYSGVGQKLADNSNFVEMLAKRLGVTYKAPAEEGAGGRF